MQQTENVKSEQIAKTAAMIIYRYVKNNLHKMKRLQ